MSIIDDLSRFIREQSRAKLIVGGIVVAGILGLVVINPRDQDYMMAVEAEIPLAQAICENAGDWVRDNISKLKMNQSNLEHILVNGEKVELKYIKYPQALILHDGFGHSNAQVELYCTFRDPRSNDAFFYDYQDGVWTAKTITRR